MTESSETPLQMVDRDPASREAAEQGTSATCMNCLQEIPLTRSELISNGRIHYGLVLLIVLVVTVLTALSTHFAGSSGEEPPSAEPLPCAACPEGWIGFESKCFYFSDNAKNWTSSQLFCVSEKANLVHIDSQKEMNFLKRYRDGFPHWIGLSRNSSNDPWKWTDNTGNNVWFIITGDEDYAYLNDGVSSGRGYSEKRWICSKLSNYADKCQVYLTSL